MDHPSGQRSRRPSCCRLQPATNKNVICVTRQGPPERMCVKSLRVFCPAAIMTLRIRTIYHATRQLTRSYYRVTDASRS